MEEYCMYFPFFELHGWGKRFAVQPQAIYSEIPKYTKPLRKPAAFALLAQAAADFQKVPATHECLAATSD